MTFILTQNYPNPFNPATSINYNLPRTTHVTLKIYDIQGREIRTLVNEYQSAGRKSAIWDGLDELGQRVASGVYVYRISTGEFSSSQKMVLVQ